MLMRAFVLIFALAMATCSREEPSGLIQVDAEQAFEQLLAQEDTDGDRQITIRDQGPGHFEVSGTVIAGTYPLSNLLQELVLLREEGASQLDLDRIFEHPVDRVSRMIRDYYWDGLTRRIDKEGLSRIAVDTKASSTRPRVYVPSSDPPGLAYFSRVAEEQPELDLEVVRLPEAITPEYVRSINDRPGILALGLEQDGGRTRGVPFVVPGGRFNEMYGWDSYFEALGLLADGRVDLAKAMVDNFVYQITHYGQILNANRSYYLTRSQPPFLTSMAISVHDALEPGVDADEWLRGVLLTAMREYETVWTTGPRLTTTGLSRYFGSGLGKPPETEEGHFDSVFAPHAREVALEVEAYTDAYAQGEIKNRALDEYFVQDRAVRESGHDTSYRLEGRAANLNTVDLNALLYRYESDLARVIEERFGGEIDGRTGAEWSERARVRRRLVDSLLWNEQAGWYYDFDFVEGAQTEFESATAFYPLWAGMATDVQAAALVANALPALETTGGVASTSRASVGQTGAGRPQRQWDWPYGWAPHQIIIWEGLQRYGYEEDAQRLAAKWLTMIARNARDYNGTVPEKYDVVRATHEVFVEYGNVGTDFAYITREGFGWMNASFQIGLDVVSGPWADRLRADTDWR